MDVLEALQHRRSIRRYTGEPLTEEQLTSILHAGLLSASSRGLQPWELVVVRDRKMLDRLSQSRAAAAMLKDAACAVVVTGDEKKSDVWTEDCSIVMANMHLAASSIGVGSCWIQVRKRSKDETQTAEEYVRNLLGIPENMRVEAILSLGMPDEEKAPKQVDDRLATKVHFNKY